MELYNVFESGVAKKSLIIIAILLVAGILRFYNLPGYIQFLGDQGRDVLVVMHMIVDHQWTLLGPNASVGGFFTGPIYYYFMIPFLWLWRLDPVGPTVMAALFGIATVGMVYILTKILFGERAAVIAAFLTAISPKMVDISRYSWNPNPVPFFALLTIFFLYWGANSRRLVGTFLAGVSLGIMFQLHYIDLVFVPIVGLALLFVYKPREWLVQIPMVIGGFILGDSLFLIFEIRHGFPNLRSVFEFITRGKQTVAPRNMNLLTLEIDMARRLYELLFKMQNRDLLIWPFLVGSVVSLVVWIWKSTRIKTVLILVWLLVGLLGIGSYQGQLYDHYFGYLYPLPFMLLGLTGDLLLSRRWLVPVFVLGGAVLIYFSVLGQYFWTPPQYMLDQVQRIDRIVLNYAGDNPYNLGLISSYNSDYGYRYFLEIWGRKPVTIENPQIDPERRTTTQTLVVVCEDKKCEPLGNSRWEVAGFGRAEIVDETAGPAGIRIFKLIHYTGK